MRHHRGRRLQKNTRQAAVRHPVQGLSAPGCARPGAVASRVTCEELKALMAVASGQDPAPTWER